MKRPWDDLIGEEESIRSRRAGYGRRAGMGTRPAVLLVDLYGTDVALEAEGPAGRFSDPEPPGHEASMRAIEMLLTAARASRVPIFFSTNQYAEDGRDLGGWRHKTWSAETHARLMQGRPFPFLPGIVPGPGEWVIHKQRPSVFFGTPLLSHLVELRVGTLLIGGQTTSGCVRATVVDAFSYGFRTTVVEECTYDRSPTSHKVNLFDMDQKYADVTSLSEVLAYLAGGAVQPGGSGDAP